MGRTNRKQKSDYKIQNNYKKKERKRNERRQVDRFFNRINIDEEDLNDYALYEEYDEIDA